ncbi:hypothetical protein Hanom_Chr04g00285591 [Helianthus anomalus]
MYVPFFQLVPKKNNNNNKNTRTRLRIPVYLMEIRGYLPVVYVDAGDMRDSGPVVGASSFTPFFQILLSFFQ